MIPPNESFCGPLSVVKYNRSAIMHKILRKNTCLPVNNRIKDPPNTIAKAPLMILNMPPTEEKPFMTGLIDEYNATLDGVISSWTKRSKVDISGLGLILREGFG